MHTATAITVLDRAGTHSAVYVPPPSRQPRPVAKPSRYDRGAIMSAAWLDYRAAVRKGWVKNAAEGRARFAYCLSFAWMVAKVAVEKAERIAAMDAAYAASLSRPAAPVVYSNPARAEAIKNELQVIEYSDGYSAATALREGDLNAELIRLRI